MGNRIDCCYTTRGFNQCLFPCIRTCSYSNRRIFYNYDGMETVQPLVHFYFPSRNTVHKLHKELELCEKDEMIRRLLQDGLDSVEQLSVLCYYASKNGYTIKAVGTGSSWSSLTSTRDILIDMTPLNRILTPPPKHRSQNLTKEYVDIEVEGGMKVVDFVEALDSRYGLGLPMIGNYAGQTVAGVASTSTHGSGMFAGTLSTLVVGLHLVTSRGIQVQLSDGPETFDECKVKLDEAQTSGDPVEMKSTSILRAAVVGLGSIGIVYSITYRCIPVFNLEEERAITKVPWTDKASFKIKDHFATMMNDREEGEYFSFFINPYPQPRGYLYAAYLRSKRTTRRPGCCKWCICCCCPGGRGCSDCGLVQTDCIASCLQGCANCCPSSIPEITNCGLSFMSTDHPFVHKYYNVLQFTKGNFHVRTAEWCLPLSQLDAALADVIDTAIMYATRHNQYSLLPIYVRFAMADDLILSPANRNFASGETEHCCYIEVPFMPGAFGTDEYQQTIGELLFEKYRARPHWGKVHQLSTDRVKALYPSGLDEWMDVFTLFNRDGIFSNQFTKQMGFDAVLANRNVISMQPVEITHLT